jgi:hypothetical protein
MKLARMPPKPRADSDKDDVGEASGQGGTNNASRSNGASSANGRSGANGSNGANGGANGAH